MGDLKIDFNTDMFCNSEIFLYLYNTEYCNQNMT